MSLDEHLASGGTGWFATVGGALVSFTLRAFQCLAIDCQDILRRRWTLSQPIETGEKSANNKEK